jgi:hypothetical protein
MGNKNRKPCYQAPCLVLWLSYFISLSLTTTPCKYFAFFVVYQVCKLQCVCKLNRDTGKLMIHLTLYIHSASQSQGRSETLEVKGSSQCTP